MSLKLRIVNKNPFKINKIVELLLEFYNLRDSMV